MSKKGKGEIGAVAADVAGYIDEIRSLHARWLAANEADAGKSGGPSPIGENEDQGGRELVAAAIVEWRKLSEVLAGWAIRAAVADTASSNMTSRRSLAWALVSGQMEYSRKRKYVVAVLSAELASEVLGGLTKLEYGEVESIFEPGKRSSYRSAQDLLKLRRKALQHCHYLYGTGISMAAAQNQVGAALGETSDNVRNWDRAENRKMARSSDLKHFFLSLYAIFQFAGARVAGFEQADALKRLNIPLDRKTANEIWTRPKRKSDPSKDRPLFFDKELAELGVKYREVLQEKKEKARRRRR